MNILHPNKHCSVEKNGSESYYPDISRLIQDISPLDPILIKFMYNKSQYNDKLYKLTL